MRSIALTGGPAVHRFHSFLFADLAARAPHVHALHIGTARRLKELTDKPEDASLLIEILSSLPRLESLLVLLEDGSRRCTHDRRVVDAISMIPNLRSLSILGRSKGVPRLLSRMRAPLRKLVIDCDNIISDFWHPAALEEFLPHLVPALEEFEMSDLLITPQEATVHGAVTSASISSMAQYPAVHSLTVRGFAGPPFLEHLQHLFPSVDQKLALGRLDLDIDTLIYADIRNANKSAQKEESPDYLRPWKKLDLVVCDVPMFYVLGLRCPIRHAMLDYGWSHYRGYLTDALRENPVPRLELSIALSYGLGAFDELFPLELVPTLTHLTLCLVYANMGGSGTDADAGFDFRWRDVLLLSSLGRLRALTHLRLVIHTDVCHDPPESEPYSEAFVNDLRGPTFGFQETAQVLANALPSLRYVFLTTRGYLGKHDESTRYFWKAYERRLVSRAWRIADKGGEQRREGLILVELAEAVAETLIDQEELLLSPADEISLHIGED